MATIYRHKKSEIGSKTPEAGDLQTGELAINLASGKTHTTRVLYSGTFVGKVQSVSISGSISTLTLVSAAATSIFDEDIIAARTTDSSGPIFAPDINTSAADGDASGTTLKVDTIVGRQFAADDYIWIVDKAVDSEQILEISGHSSAGAYAPLNPNTGDIWVDISEDPVKIMIFGDSDFVEFESGGGGDSGGSSGFTSDDLEDADTGDIDFGLINVLSDNTALATTYSAVDYNFGGIRSPRPGPDFGELS